MNMHLDISIYLLDGAAFGKTSYNTSLMQAPKPGEILRFTELLPLKVKDKFSSNDLGLIEATLGKLLVTDVSTPSSASAETGLFVEIDPIVLESRHVATQLLAVLSTAGFDSDVWT